MVLLNVFVESAMGDSETEQKVTSYSSERQRYHAPSGSGSDLDADSDSLFGVNDASEAEVRDSTPDRSGMMWDYYPTASSSDADSSYCDKSSSVYVTSGMRQSNIQDQEMRVFSKSCGTSNKFDKRYGTFTNGQDSRSSDDTLDSVVVHQRFHDNNSSRNIATSNSANQSSLGKFTPDDDPHAASERQFFIGGGLSSKYEHFRNAPENKPKVFQPRAADQAIDFSSSLLPSATRVSNSASTSSRRSFMFGEGAAETRTSEAHSSLMHHSKFSCSIRFC